jgi:hypothetical protein
MYSFTLFLILDNQVQEALMATIIITTMITGMGMKKKVVVTLTIQHRWPYMVLSLQA